MRLKSNKQRLSMALPLALCAAISACGVSIPDEAVPNQNQNSSGDLLVDPSLFKDSAPVKADLNLAMAALSPFATESSAALDPRLLSGLADCNCSQARFASKYLAKLVTRGGPMPQLLMPMIREGVAADPQVQRILNMSPASRAILDGMVNVDNMIETQVKATVAGKVSAALIGGSTVADRYDFRFDGFAGSALGPLTAPQSFTIGDQATRWNYILGMDALWSGKSALDGVDHGLQLLNTALLLSEWSYMFGLDVSTANGQPYGGLTMQPDANSPANLHGLPMAPFDPRINPDGMRFVSGNYTIDYPAADSLEMATEVQESWQHGAGTVTLDEQASIWRAAARAMARLRPAARSKTASLYAANTGIFPADAHTASLLFLPGMDLLLDGPFFSTLAQSVREEANFARLSDGTFDVAGYPDVRNPIFKENRVLALSRLATALSEWIDQVRSVDDLQIDEATKARLQAAHKRLKDPVRLALVVLMRELPADLGGIGTSEKLPSRTAMAPGSAAEVMFNIARTLDVGLESEFLRSRAFSLMDHYAANYLKPLWSDAARRAEIAPADVVWIHNALDAIGKIEGSAARYPWLADVKAVFAKAIADWNNSL